MDLLADRFEAERRRLHAVAYRMLGSHAEAEDAVQEAWLRLSRTDGVDNLGGWLTTVVARVCLDMLRTRTARREDPLDAAGDPGYEQEDDAVRADSVGLAMLVVLETLNPGERLAFVLHDMFGVPFEEIEGIVGKSPAAARQLASRGRRRVREAGPSSSSDLGRRREVVGAFLKAAREGDFEGLLALLDPDAELRADAAAVAMGVDPVLVGASAVAGRFNGGAQSARPVLVDGLPGLAWWYRGEAKVVFDFDIRDGLVVGIEQLADPEVLAGLDLALDVKG